MRWKLGSPSPIHKADKFQPAFQSIKAGSDCGWPHTRNRYILQLGIGSLPGANELDGLAFNSLAEAPYQIYPDHDAADYLPHSLQPFNDYSKVCTLDVLVGPTGRLTSYRSTAKILKDCGSYNRSSILRVSLRAHLTRKQFEVEQ